MDIKAMSILLPSAPMVVVSSLHLMIEPFEFGIREQESK